MSSLKDLASLIMVPSLYKDGELHTVKPLADENIIVHPDATDNNDGVDGTTPSTSSNFTFSRGSNLAATRVDVNGLIEKGRENLYTQSNNFSHSDWSPKVGTFAKGVTDPNGGTDAWSWTATNTDPFLYQAKNFTGVHCLSIYVKGVGSTIGEDFQIRVASAIKDVTLTGDWQRVQHFGVLSGSANIGFEYGNPATANDVVHIYAAQLEQGLAATDYIETGASTAQAGILEDMPRLDYSGSCPSLLLEPQRSNLFDYSEYFGSTSWVKSNSSVTTNTAVSPSGNTDANLITSSGSEGQIYQTKTLNGSHTFSAFFKAGTSVLARLQFYDSGAGTSGVGIYNLTTLSVSATGLSSTGTITDYGNGWYRCTLTASLSGSAVLCFLGLNENAKNISAWGAQLEQGSYPTSYIPTYGTSVTRSFDECLDAGDNSVIDSTQGTIYGEQKSLESNFTYNYFVAVSDGTNNNRLEIRQAGTTLQFLYRVGGVYKGARSLSNAPFSSNIKYALRYSSTDIKFYVNGSLVGTFNSPTLYPSGTLNNLQFADGSGGTNFRGVVNQSLYFPTALTDSECIALTTL